MKIKDVIWFTTGRGETIGIVLGNAEVTGAAKSYIGVGDGKYEALDAKQISEWGAKIRLQDLVMITDHLKGVQP